MPESFDQFDKFANATRRFREQVDFIMLAGDIVFFESASAKVIEEFKASGKGQEILDAELTSALVVNSEYGDNSQFSSRLEEAFSDPNIIFIYPDATTQTLKCEILAEQYVGSAEEYEEAVKTVRAAYSNSVDPVLASIAWYTMYKVAREGKQLTSKKGEPLTEKMNKMVTNYYRTIAERLSSVTFAPYWYILNYGSTSYGAKVGSAGDGKAYPQNPPTYFVEKSQSKIEIELVGLLKAEIERMIDEFEAEIERFSEQLDEYSPGEIITTLKLGHQNFAIYKTPKLGRLGFRRL